MVTKTIRLTPKSRLEVNICELLKKCESLARHLGKDNNNWRLKLYVNGLGDLLNMLKSSDFRPPDDVVADYSRRLAFLKGIVKTLELQSPIQKLEVVQQISHGPATMSIDGALQEIHQKTVAKYGMELRSELFGNEEDDTLRKRNIIKSPNFTSVTHTQEDVDSILKFHQNMQEKVAENMVMLTKSLKEQSQIASTIIKRDTEALHKSSSLAERNMATLKLESERLQEHSKSAWKCWLWVMLAIVMTIFINMVMFMKVMKKKTY